MDAAAHREGRPRAMRDRRGEKRVGMLAQQRQGRKGRWSSRLALLAGLTTLVLVAACVSQAAAGDIYEFKSVPSTSEAGGHPDVLTSLEIATRFTTEGEHPPCEC